jgi:hypothetical protein
MVEIAAPPPTLKLQRMARNDRSILKEGQDFFAFFFFVMSVPFLEAARQAEAFGIAFLVLFVALHVHGEISIGIRYGIPA